MSETIYLGYNSRFGSTSLTKHSWDCGWYWGFGYLGNKNCHWHTNSRIHQNRNEYDFKSSDFTQIKTHFQTTWLTQNQWWILRDLFIQAYALKKAAECFVYGGYQTSDAKDYRITDSELAKTINSKLEILLNNIWELLLKWKNNVVV